MIFTNDLKKELRSYFENGLRSLSYPFEPFWIYLQLLVKWNSKINLTTITDPMRVVEEHFIDSLAAIPYLEKSKSLLDIGSGAGFPGIPLAIARPEVQIVLCESIKKKSDFLREVVRQLNLKNVVIKNMRLEEGSILGRFDSIVSRGTMDIHSLIKLSGPSLSQNGQIISYKGPEVEKELLELELKGLRIEEYRYLLPYSKKRRVLIIIKKTN
ncbi:MAG: 16S rRNA (guanine(527)-N(7))-methyltransferase RsmG [Deltaproteobacteria bacterium]|nr:16S rRNA (guanine(527)-N(7))-methyltransferase RsmG [Deltaproteobacteria bacterium]